MTTITQALSAPGRRVRMSWAVTDTLTLTRRSLLVWVRVPAYLVFTVIQPVMFVLLFRYVFGGAIHVQAPGGYVDYLLPGIIGQTAAFATFGTAIVLAQELKKGVIDRLRSMPIARSAVLTGRPDRGHPADDGHHLDHRGRRLRRGVPVPQRRRPGHCDGRAGHRVRGGDRVRRRLDRAGHRGRGIGPGVRYDLAVPADVRESSAFVPISSMPGWLQAFANNQPVTYVIDTMRALALGGPVAADLWKSLAWLAGIFIVFLPLAVRAYRRAS